MFSYNILPFVSWFWGLAGCQVFGYFAFFFGNFQLMITPLVAFDRYVCVSGDAKFSKVLAYIHSKNHYERIIVSIIYNINYY
jgi:hypothetical protein